MRQRTRIRLYGDSIIPASVSASLAPVAVGAAAPDTCGRRARPSETRGEGAYGQTIS